MIRRPAQGFTLIEMIIAIVAVGIIFVLGAMVLGRAFESYDLARQTTDVAWQGRIALERMVRELRDIRTPSAADLAFTPGEIRFIDARGNAVCFYQAATTLWRSADGPAGTCGTTNPQPLADNLPANALAFDFYDDNGAVAAAAPAVRYVSVRLTVARGAVSETYRATVRPRRF